MPSLASCHYCMKPQAFCLRYRKWFKLASLRSRRRLYPTDNLYQSTTTIPSNAHPPNRSHSYPVSLSQATPTATPLPPLDTMSTGRDRTAEFSSVVRSLQSYQVCISTCMCTSCACTLVRMSIAYYVYSLHREVVYLSVVYVDGTIGLCMLIVPLGCVCW